MNGNTSCGKEEGRTVEKDDGDQASKDKREGETHENITFKMDGIYSPPILSNNQYFNINSGT